MIPFVLLALLASPPPRAHAEPAFRGYAAIEQTVTDRLLADGTGFSFRRYLKSTDTKVEAKALLDLLGTYDETSGSDQFKNGDPNSVNMLLWQLLLEAMGQELSLRCSHTGTLHLNPVFQAAIDPLCQWPAPSAKTDSALRGFWTAVMGYDAPEEEFLAWEQFALTSSYAGKPAAEAVPILFFLVAYNPYFLLRN